MSIRKSLIPVVAKIRALAGPTFADVRINQLTIRTRTWSGAYPQDGTYTDSDLVLPPHFPIRRIESAEVRGVDGAYETGDIIVDHITPSDGAGTGYTLAQLAPRPTTNNVEIIYLITGEHPGEYALVDARSYRSFTYQLVLRRRLTTPMP